jgi:hypothetical protein
VSLRDSDSGGELVTGVRVSAVKILLTATVTPQPLPGPLDLRDPAIRRQQYIEGLRQWVALAAENGGSVVFFENNGEDLAALARDAFGPTTPANLELINARPSAPEDLARGKGATEAAMMDEFCERFYDDPDEVWYKCTGRLFVKNFARCTPDAVPPNSFIARLSLELTHMDARIFGATANAWRQYFTGAGEAVEDAKGMFIEHVLAKRLLRGLSEDAHLVRFRAQPQLIGRSGSYSGRQYDSPRSRAKRAGANLLERGLRGPLRRKHF